jgi:hypothetical protein
MIFEIIIFDFHGHFDMGIFFCQEENGVCEFFLLEILLFFPIIEGNTG